MLKWNLILLKMVLYMRIWFSSSNTTTINCELDDSITCDSSNIGKSYVSSCTPSAYTCSSGTKLNDSFCYIIN